MNCTNNSRENREREPGMGSKTGKSIEETAWHIYVREIPHSERGDFWVSFESERNLVKTKANIYARCLPCIQHLYDQLKAGSKDINLGPAYHCWKIAAVLNGIEECLSLLAVYEEKFPGGHVYGKFGSGRAFSETKVVVFHTDEERARDLVRERLETCLPEVNKTGRVEVSRACAVLYADILGDWREWQPVTRMKHPEKVQALIQRIRKALFLAAL
jgi:hypothetical protein